MPNRYWVGGTGTWDAANTANWSATSGGAGGASIPTSADDVYLDSNSGVGNITATQGSCRSFYCTNSVTGSYSGTLTLGTNAFQTAMQSFGDFILSPSMTLTMTQLVYLFIGQGAGTKNINFAGKSYGTTYSFYIGAGGCIINLLSDITHNPAQTGVEFTLSGTIITNNYNIQIKADNGNAVATFTMDDRSRLGSTVFNVQASNVRVINTSSQAWEASTLLINKFSNPTTNTSIVIGSGNSATINRLRIITPTTITGNITISACTIVGPTAATSAQPYLAFNGDANGYPTINGNFYTESTAPNRRVLISSGTYGLGQTVAINASTNLSDVDFRDIYVVGTNAPISGTRIGNRGNNTGISFTAAKTVYTVFNGTASVNWYDNIWSNSPAGSPSLNNFPLAQDTVIVQNNSLTSIALNATAAGNVIGSIDMSARTSALSLTTGNPVLCYGNWTNGSGITFTNSNGLTFTGGGIRTITSAGKAMSTSAGVIIDTYGGTVQLADALTIGTGQTLLITNGTFNTQGYAVTAGVLSSNNSNVRTINLGASIVTLNASTTVITFTNTTNLTFNAGTSTINAGPDSGGNWKVIDCGTTGVTFWNMRIEGSNNPTPTASSQIIGPCIFANNLTFVAKSFDSIFHYTIDSNIVVNGQFSCSGLSAIRRVYVRSSVSGTQRTITANTILADDCDFRDIAIAGPAAGVSPVRAGNCGGNSGINFPAPKTVYWNLAGAQNWSATAWAPSSGGTPDINQFPLPQDTAVFDNVGSAGTITFTFGGSYNIGTFDASNRTAAMTITIGTNSRPLVYGDWKSGTGVTIDNTTGSIVFCKNSTQTITSNGVQFGCNVVIEHLRANVQLADALSLNSARTLALNAGTFDAVTYNVTAGVFGSSSGGTLRMGSGTWTLSGVGTVWSNSGVITTLYIGTSTIVLSDTSTTARTFSGNSCYYNKLTIGGTTGTSTLTITGANFFGELASTKTVAHTIALGTAGQTVGKWSITGTLGNVVTVTGTAALTIAGPAVSNVDYLAMGTTTLSTTSPGEFYAGANSTGTGSGITLSAAPAARTLYWRGGTGNWSATTSWDTVQNGAGGAAIPRSMDAVIFDSTSNATAYTATIDAGISQARCASFTMAGPASGNVTFAGTTPIAFHGSVSIAASGVTRSYSGSMTLAGDAAYTLSLGGNFSNTLTLNSPNASWTLGSTLSNNSINLNAGSFNTSGFTIISSGLLFPSLNKCSASFGSSSISIANNGISFVGTNLTENLGTSTINLQAGNGLYGNTRSSTGGSAFNNIVIGSTVSDGMTSTIGGTNTINSLSLGTNAGNTSTTGIVSFEANQTISTLTAKGNLTGVGNFYKMMMVSNVIGTPRTLTVSSVGSTVTDVDFRDIVIAGAVAPLSTVRCGDCKGNSGITFPAAKTVYWNLAGGGNWGAGVGWAASPGATPALTNLPLAQDTAIILSTGLNSGATITIEGGWHIGTIDMSARTSNTMTLAVNSGPTIYGNWINGTGTTISGTGRITYAGRINQTLTSAGKTFTTQLGLNSPGGSLILQDAFSTSANFSDSNLITAGTFDASGFNVTTAATINGQCGISTAGSLTKVIAIGSGTWTLGCAGNVWNNVGTNVTITGTGTISLTNSSTKTFIGGSISYSGITLNHAGAGTLTISGNNTFANISKSFTGATTISLGSAITRVGAWTSTGTAGNLLSITGTSAASPATLIYTGAGTISGIDYVDVSFIRAYPLATTWNVGANSTSRNSSLGFILPAITRQKAGNFLAFF